MKKKILIALAIILLILICVFILLIVNKNSELKAYKFKNAELSNKLSKSVENCDEGRIGVPRYCEVEYSLTEKYDIYSLLLFQSLPEEERSKQFKNSYNNNSKTNSFINLSGILDNFVDDGKQYKIGKDYCIAKSPWSGKLEKVQCNKPTPIERLPYERCEKFLQYDDEGVYYLKYDLNKIKKEFKSKKLDEIKKELEDEQNKVIDQEKKNATERMRRKYGNYSQNAAAVLMCAIEGICD